MRRVKITTLAIALFTAMPVWAGSIDVTIGKGGSIDVNKKTGPVQGRRLDVTTLGIGSDILSLLNGHLTFITGAETDHQGSSYTYGEGGGLRVTGCVDLGSDGDKCGLLVTGKFLNAEIVEQGGKYYLEAEVLEQINPKLAALMDLTTTTYLAKLDLALVQVGHNKRFFRESVKSGSLLTITEPSSILLLALPLLSLAISRKFWTGMPAQATTAEQVPRYH
jgi:hypothetical protein